MVFIHSYEVYDNTSTTVLQVVAGNYVIVAINVTKAQW